MKGAKKQELKDALLSAFSQRSMAEMLSFRLNKNFGAIIQPDAFNNQVTELIELAVREGWIAELVHAAKASVPGNARLQRFVLEPEGREGGDGNIVAPHGWPTRLLIIPVLLVTLGAALFPQIVDVIWPGQPFTHPVQMSLALAPGQSKHEVVPVNAEPGHRIVWAKFQEQMNVGASDVRFSYDKQSARLSFTLTADRLTADIRELRGVITTYQKRQ
jgi:hypothetical protein